MRAAVNIGRAAQPRTYAEFRDHINTLASNTTRGWSADGRGVGTFLTDCATPTGAMQGSTWGGPGGSAGIPNLATQAVARMVQHAMPSAAVFNDNVSAGRRVLLTVATAGTLSSPSGLNRNGYTSASYSGTVVGRVVTLMLYWYDEQAWQIDPSAGGSPTPYSW